MRSRRPFTTIRFSLRDCAYGMWISNRATETSMLEIRAGCRQGTEGKASAGMALVFLRSLTAGRSLLQNCRELLDLEGFDHIADFHVLEALDADAAFETLANLRDVVLEVTKRGDL